MTNVLSHQGGVAPSIQDFLRFREERGHSVTDVDHYMGKNFNFFIKAKGISTLSQVTPAQVYAWVCENKSHTNRTKNHRLAFARAFFRYLLREDIIDSDPTAGISYFKPEPFEPHVFTLEDLGRLLREADSWKERPRRPHSWTGWVMNTLIHLLYACGLRINEAIKLNVEDVNLREKTLSLWRTKFHKERLIPFSDRIHEKLQRYLKERSHRFPEFRNPDTPLFCHKAGAYRYYSLWVHWDQLLKKCGLEKDEGPRLHDLRHTFAVHRLYKWYQEEQDIMNKLPLLSTYMGHVSVEDTQIYLTITRALLRQGNLRFKAHAEHIPRQALQRVLRHHGFHRS